MGTITVTQRAEIDNTGYNVGNDPVTQGEIAVRWAKLTYIGDRLLSRENHRTVLWPENDIDATMEQVSEHLASMGFEWDTKEADLILLKALADQIWTPEIKQARAAHLQALQDAADKAAAEAEALAAQGANETQ